MARDAEATAEQEAIYRAFQKPVRTLARRLVPLASQAEDLAHDVFVEVLQSLGQYDGRGSFAGWIRTITVRKCLMHLRSPWHRSLRWMESLVVDELEPRGAPRVSTGGETLDVERALARAQLRGWLEPEEVRTPCLPVSTNC